VVVLRPGQELTGEQVIANARQHIGGFKLPKRVYFAGELPKNVSGKVLKTRLREMVADGQLDQQTQAAPIQEGADGPIPERATSAR
jgi:acyl-CoA synthetase (AMP-forming)/AMP-acid ligase II